jgi:hypothetical protein
VGVHQLTRRDRRVDPGLDEARGRAVGGGRGAAERAGVGDEAGVETAGDVGVEFDAHRVEHGQHEDGRGLGRLVDQVVGAEPVAGHVMVDDQHRSPGGDRRFEPVDQWPQPAPAAGVAGDQEPADQGNLGGGHQQARRVEAEERGRHVVGRAEGDPHVRTPPVQRQPERERGTERVGVGVDVREQGDVGGGCEEFRRRGEIPIKRRCRHPHSLTHLTGDVQ